ncbi:hypothetical protein DL767_010197 [Monosporascus sp. MG133]|nr:hypothetical protein DL767_010197 [Monosporascus sp. MG133]
MADLRPPNPPSTGTPAPAEASTMESHSTTQAETALPMKCCCGRLNCVFLRHNCSVLDSVEKDVHTAARMGQALLARHEAYMADAERDRKELTTRIEQLEMDNKELEARNARTIEDNRNLLDQLEALNSTVNDSEGRIKSLEATLLFSQQTIRRLEGETARAEALERQLMLLEQEQADLQNNLLLSRDEARSAVSRWKRAEREINDLQEQLERIEREARQEREHHAEMMSRIEKQREMEKELNTAAGRLKGAAAIKSIDYGKNGGNVVSHFVRDLLQDNANLQHGASGPTSISSTSWRWRGKFYPDAESRARTSELSQSAFAQGLPGVPHPSPLPRVEIGGEETKEEAAVTPEWRHRIAAWIASINATCATAAGSAFAGGFALVFVV